MPAEVAGTGLWSFHIAAASCERAELWVHTNTTRSATRAGEVGTQQVEDVAVERDVAAAAVSFRPVPGQQPGVFEHAQVMGQQVRRHPEPGGQLARRCLTPGQGVDDREPSGIAERGMQRRPPHHRTGSPQ